LPFRVEVVEQTPNPNVVKFVLDRPICEGSISFFNAAAAVQHPVASRLFGIKGVVNVLLLRDFITVSKSPDASWSQIKTQVRKVLESV